MNQVQSIVNARYPENVNASQHFGELLLEYEESGFAPPHLIDAISCREEEKFWSHVWEAIL